MKRWARLLVSMLAAAALAGCGAAASTPARTSTMAPSATAAPSTPASTPSAIATATPSPSTTTMVIAQYGVAITLPSSVADAVYSIDTSQWGPGPTAAADANGTPYTMYPPVRVWTQSLSDDLACSEVPRRGLMTISVFATDPTDLVLGSGPSGYEQIGKYWFGVSQEQAQECTDGNPEETASVQALLQAYGTIHAS